MNRIKKEYLLVALLIIGGIMAMSFYSEHSTEQLLNSTALHNARLYSQALTEFRTLYTRHIVKVARKNNLKVSHNFLNKDDTIPLPATLSMLLGREIGKHSSGAETKLYSGYPFPWRNSESGEALFARDRFADEAWNALRDNPKKEYYKFTEYQGRPVLRFASADIMRRSCVQCHNTHEQTPYNKWQVGDVRGVLEVIMPMDQVMAETASSRWNYRILFTITLATILLTLFIVFRNHRRTRENLESELAVRTGEIKNKELELSQVRKMEAIGQLAAGVAHEINTPAQFIGDNLRFLEDSFNDLLSYKGKLRELCEAQADTGQKEKIEALSEEVDEEFLDEEIPLSISQSIDGITRIGKIVGAMKEFSHPGDGQKSLTDINHCIETTVTVARNEWRTVAEVKLDLDENLPQVPLLAGEFNQALLNLIINAVHTIADARLAGSGVIEISTSVQGESVVVAVTDNGCGMDDKVRERVFEPFFTTKEVGRGSGQGLSIVHTVVEEKHNGKIEIKSKVNEGTTFFIYLPLLEYSR